MEQIIKYYYDMPIKVDDTALNTFISSTYSENLKAVNNQIDKKAETWYQSTDPSIQWITIDLKEAHIGDLWYNTTNKKNYVFTSSVDLTGTNATERISVTIHFVIFSSYFRNNIPIKIINFV